jgi:hypothetical protein
MDCITDIQTDTDRQTQTGRQTDRHTDTQTDTQTDRLTDRQTHRHTDRYTDRQLERQETHKVSIHVERQYKAYPIMTECQQEQPVLQQTWRVMNHKALTTLGIVLCPLCSKLILTQRS